eukprot:16128058-Heterocapsa_arctica.AAC.1
MEEGRPLPINRLPATKVPHDLVRNEAGPKVTFHCRNCSSTASQSNGSRFKRQHCRMDASRSAVGTGVNAHRPSEAGALAH